MEKNKAILTTEKAKEDIQEDRSQDADQDHCGQGDVDLNVSTFVSQIPGQVPQPGKIATGNQ